MGTSTHYFTGPCKWAKLHSPDKTYGYYSIDIQLDAKQLEQFKELKLKNRPKEDGWLSFRRRPDQKVWRNGIQELAGAPRVVDSQGSRTTELVGNGSSVTIELSVYDYNHPLHGKGRGSRLEAVRVDKLEKYERADAANAPTHAASNVAGPPSVPVSRRLF